MPVLRLEYAQKKEALSMLELPGRGFMFNAALN
jgi:hypothetical protein